MRDDLAHINEIPCARNSLLAGIASGFGIGVIRGINTSAFFFHYMCMCMYLVFWFCLFLALPHCVSFLSFISVFIFISYVLSLQYFTSLSMLCVLICVSCPLLRTFRSSELGCRHIPHRLRRYLVSLPEPFFPSFHPFRHPITPVLAKPSLPRLPQNKVHTSLSLIYNPKCLKTKTKLRNNTDNNYVYLLCIHSFISNRNICRASIRREREQVRGVVEQMAERRMRRAEQDKRDAESSESKGSS